jgi:hypothetical protein
MADIIFGSGISIGTGISVTPPPLTAPDAPTIGSATATGATTATVAFTQPGNNGGSTITSYTATSSPGNITGTLSQAGSGTINITGLTQGTSYTFTVTATNAIGTSSASSASNSITTYTVPGAPTIGVATATSATTATVAFTAPASNGGSTITSYTATSSPGSITGTLSQAGSGTITVSGLTASTSYTFTVTATNSIGTSSPSSASNSITTSAPQDSYFMYNTLLLPGNGTNNAQNNTFLDGSTNNFAITRAGNTTQGTFSPYGANWSNYFDGTGDYLTAAQNAAFNFGTGAFTVEAWVYLTAYPSGGEFTSILSLGNGAAAGSIYTGWGLLFTNASISFYRYDGSTETNNSAATAIPLNTWSHVVAVRNGSSSLSIYLNGTRILNTTSSVAYNNVNSNNLNVGYWRSGASPTDRFLTGYISNGRIVNGTAVYNPTLTTLTVPTAPLTAVSGTSLLTSQSNRFIDNSTNAFTITVNGNTNIQRFSPFSPTQAYSAGTIGGSAYFDGTGDYLTLPGASQATLTANSNFTFEAWVYLTGYSGTYNGIWGGNGGDIVLAYSTSNSWGIYPALSGAPPFMYSGMSVLTGMFNRWAHVALTRNGNSWNLWVDGVSVASATQTSTSIPNTTKSIGSEGAGANPMMGYISNARYTSAALYTTAFTSPTSPLTTSVASGSVQMLTNFTNGGIIDNAMMNNLETVGNAQISTAQSKFGGSSMLFDGNGDYLSIPNTQLLNLTSGNFTIEAWVYYLGTNANGVIVDKDGVFNSTFPSYSLGLKINKLNMFIGSGNGISYAQEFTAGADFLTNQWVHVAVVRSGSIITVYQNGTSVASGTQTGTMVDGGKATLVGYQSGQPQSLFWNGYIDDLRITRGVARYTSTFTPPTQAFPTY